MKKYEPLRTCVACRKKQEKKNMLRLVKDETGSVVADEKGTLDGRGVYVCKDGACYDLLVKKKGLERAFKKKISEEEYNRVAEAINGRKGR